MRCLLELERWRRHVSVKQANSADNVYDEFDANCSVDAIHWARDKTASTCADVAELEHMSNICLSSLIELHSLSVDLNSFVVELNSCFVGVNSFVCGFE